MYPRGKCILVNSQPDNGTTLSTKYLFILNSTFAWPKSSEILKLSVYLTDPINTIQLNPVSFQMRGKPVSFASNKLDKATYGFNYKTKISKFIHAKGDPVIDCEEHSQKLTYNDCVKKENADNLEELISCVPPWYTEDIHKSCNNSFNMTRIKEN